MEINIDAFARGKINISVGRLSAGVTAQQYHGSHCGVQRIIESLALPDKQSYRKTKNFAAGRAAEGGSAYRRSHGGMRNSQK
jgi:hypothetical protein